MEREGRLPSETASLVASLRSALLHVVVLAALVISGQYPAAVSWLLAVLGIFPFFAMVRPVLEHRRLEAGCDVDFTTQLHGAVIRTFGNGMFARAFGAAGFNQHLMHHWDPTVSYTRLADMEQFMLRTPLAAEVTASYATYGQTALAMVKQARRD
jgi:fatty acid desaturase